MNYGQRLVGIALLSVTITGCTSDIAKPVGLDVALRGVEEDMKAAAGVSLHDVLSRDAIQEDEFNRAILQAQCFYQRPNPLVPVMIKDFTLTLQGTFTSQGKFVVFGLSVPTGGIEIGTASTTTNGRASGQFYFDLIAPRCLPSAEGRLCEGLS